MLLSLMINTLKIVVEKIETAINGDPLKMKVEKMTSSFNVSF